MMEPRSVHGIPGENPGKNIRDTEVGPDITEDIGMFATAATLTEKIFSGNLISTYAGGGVPGRFR